MNLGDKAMDRIRRSLISTIAIAALALAGCASTAIAPSPTVRQALAPSGTLRIGVYVGSPTSMVKDPASGEARGVTLDLGKELAKRLGVPFEPVVYPKLADVLAALKEGKVDFTVTHATEVRAKFVDFTAPVLSIELGYLVPPGSPVTSLADVDRPGIRVGVSQGSSSQGTLSREFQNAKVITAPTLKDGVHMLSQHQLDTYATNKAILFKMSDQLPGSRVLDGRWGLEHMAIAIPKGREQGRAYLDRFAADAVAEGLVARAGERAGLRGAARNESH
jgi:polar amino acid transport system substrate-binding protein